MTMTMKSERNTFITSITRVNTYTHTDATKFERPIGGSGPIFITSLHSQPHNPGSHSSTFPAPVSKPYSHPSIVSVALPTDAVVNSDQPFGHAGKCRRQAAKRNPEKTIDSTRPILEHRTDLFRFHVPAKDAQALYHQLRHTARMARHHKHQGSLVWETSLAEWPFLRPFFVSQYQYGPFSRIT